MGRSRVGRAVRGPWWPRVRAAIQPHRPTVTRVRMTVIRVRARARRPGPGPRGPGRIRRPTALTIRLDVESRRPWRQDRADGSGLTGLVGLVGLGCRKVLAGRVRAIAAGRDCLGQLCLAGPVWLVDPGGLAWRCRVGLTGTPRRMAIPGRTRPMGTPGLTGPRGMPRRTGPSGIPGRTRRTGTPGLAGSRGIPGPTGQVSLPRHRTGAVGTPGRTGTRGRTRPMGTAGRTAWGRLTGLVDGGGPMAWVCRDRPECLAGRVGQPELDGRAA